MLKVLICDDEVKVCQLINKLIDWKGLGLIAVGMVHNGIDAYDMIKEKAPDVVITDIRMPGYNGLELIKKIRDEQIPMRFIIISGYKHFEYAHHALKYGVEDYLLKPIKKEELNDILTKIIELQKTTIRMASDHSELRTQLEESKKVLRRQFIHGICYLNNVEEMNMSDIGLLNQTYNLNFSQGVFQAVVIKLDVIENFATDDRRNSLILEKMKQQAERYLTPHCIEILTTTKGNNIICIINYGDENIDAIKEDTHIILEEGMTYLSLHEGYHITVGIGSVRDHFQQMSLSIHDAHEAIKTRILLGTNRIISGKDFEMDHRNIKAFLTTEINQQLIHIIDGLDRFGLKKWLKDLFDKFITVDKLAPNSLIEISDELMTLLLRGIEKNNLIQLDLENTKAHFYEELENAYQVHHIRELINSAFENYVVMTLEMKKTQDDKPIRIAKQYVESHYFENISLEIMASVVHLNPVYFSGLFKKEEGINFIDYLMNYRIEVSKELLKGTQDNIMTISEKVGYKDSKYFSKLFHKLVGIKPGEYRKLYT